MNAVVEWLGWTSGLLLVAPRLASEPLVLAATALAMLVTYGITLHFLAVMSGRDGRRWGLAGFAFGVAAVAVLLVLMESSPPE
ncbi:MAG: hypothetical protein ACKOCT_22735 [Alphaproteobacteria bacterium]